MVVWTTYAPDRLPQSVQRLVESPFNELVVSYASLWEMLAKVGRGKLKLTDSSVSEVMTDVQAMGVTLLPIRLDHISVASGLPHHHSDPFDRMLIAQALVENIPLVSVDRKIHNYDVRVLWE